MPRSARRWNTAAGDQQGRECPGRQGHDQARLTTASVARKLPAAQRRHAAAGLVRRSNWTGVELLRRPVVYDRRSPRIDFALSRTVVQSEIALKLGIGGQVSSGLEVRDSERIPIGS